MLCLERATQQLSNYSPLKLILSITLLQIGCNSVQTQNHVASALVKLSYWLDTSSQFYSLTFLQTLLNYIDSVAMDDGGSSVHILWSCRFPLPLERELEE